MFYPRRESYSARAVALAAALGFAQAGAGPAANLTDSVQQDGEIKSSRDFKRLRDRATTAADFTALAEYCQSRVSKYQEDKSGNEAELRRYNSKPHTTNPKFRPLDETLRIYIADDEKQIARWGELAQQYSAQASRLESKRRR